MILVLGGTGFIGQHVARAAAEHGSVRVAARRTRPGIAFPMACIDLANPESVDAALCDVEVVLHVGAHYPAHSLDREGTLATGIQELRAVLDGAARAGVRRLVYVSSTATVAAAEGRPSDERDVYVDAPRLGVYHDLKWHLERVAAAERRFEVVIACPSGCIGPGDRRIGTSAPLVAVARGIPCPHPDGHVALVDARDVGTLVARLATMSSPPQRVILSGAGVRLHDLLVSLADRYGTAPVADALSADEARALADSAERDSINTGRRPVISREIVDLVVNGVPVSAALAEQVLAAQWTPLADTLDAFDAWAEKVRLLPRSKTPAHRRSA